MDKHTKELLWKLWTNSNYVEKKYPEVAEAFQKSKEGDFSEFINKKYPGLIPELVKHSPKDNLKGGGSKKGKLGSIAKSNCPESEILKLVADDTNLSKECVQNIIDSYWGFVFAKIAEGKKVTLQKIGSFFISSRKYADNLRSDGKVKTTKTVKFDKSQNLNKECGV